MYPPLIEALLGKGYCSEQLHTVKKHAFAMYDRFKATEKGFRGLDGLDCENKWIECHKKAMLEFDKAVGLLRVFENEADNLAVEWECTMMFPLPKVQVGELFPGIEDRNDCEKNHAGQRDPKPP